MSARSFHLGSMPALAVVFTLLTLAACNETQPEVPAPVEQAAPATPTPSEPVAPAPAPTAEREPTADELPVQEDFQAEAEQQITASNLKSELDDLQKQIDGAGK